MDQTDVQNAAGTVAKTASTKSPLLLACIGVVAAGAVGAGAYAYVNKQPAQEEGGIGYAQSVLVADDQDVVEPTPPGAITLEYHNDAFSEDGKAFQCYIMNAAENEYDMYIDIYSDAELTKEIYLSQLLRPGTGFDHIELDEALPVGAHQVFVVFTQVEDDQKTLHNQTVITMNFNVTTPD